MFNGGGVTIQENKSVYIPSIDAKDLYLSNHYEDNSQSGGYSIKTKSGDINLRRFINTLDYSLDLIKLREVYEKVYRRTDFTFRQNSKEYTYRVINVTFKYSCKEYNKISNGFYVKNGWNPNGIELQDSVCLIDGELIGIQTDVTVDVPVDNSILGKYFYYEDGKYKAKSNISAVMTVGELREHLYINGFYCNGIHFVRWKRSSGSARVGKCLFIDEKLYSGMHRWEACGIKVKPGDEIDLAAFESYISLTSSSIIDTIEIYPENILVVNDYESIFTDHAAVTRSIDGQLSTTLEEVEINNSIWDGQSIIDADSTSTYSQYGMLLLRNRFFKSCCFRGKLQDWFENNGIYEVWQLNGWTTAQSIDQIKLITTPSSIKYLKFGTLDEWLGNLDPIFGVVKHDKPTHFFDGRMVQTHYQLLNTLHLDKNDVQELLAPSIEFINLLRNEPAVLRHYIKYPDGRFDLDGPLLSKNDIVYKLLGINDDFSKTKLYTDFRNDLVKSLLKELRLGHVLVNGTYCTLCGNPIEMLEQAIGKFHGKSHFSKGQIHTSKFDYGKTLVASRSPHVTMGNVWTPVNVDAPKIDRYFDFSDEIVTINSIGDNVLMRLSGADFDSDTMMVTDNPVLLRAALRHKDDFPVPTCCVEAKKVKRTYIPEQQCDLDIKTSENLIGEIINFSQELNSMLWNSLNSGATIESVMPLYFDIAQLDVMSGLEIDKAKKEFDVKNSVELKKLKAKYKQVDKNGKSIRPHFFAYLSRQKGFYDPARKSYIKFKTTMDYLHSCVNSYISKGISTPKPTLPFSAIIDHTGYDETRRNHRQISRIINLIQDTDDKIKSLWADESLGLTRSEKYIEAENIRRECSEYISNITLDRDTTIRLLRIIERKENSRIRFRMFHILFGEPSASFYKVLEESSKNIGILVPDNQGNIKVFGRYFRVQ